MDELKENICEGGRLQGHQFTLSLHAAATHIGCPKGGYYQKSAIKNAAGQVIWHWHDDKESN